MRSADFDKLAAASVFVFPKLISSNDQRIRGVFRCGISGVFNAPADDVRASATSAMLKTIKHRGADGASFIAVPNLKLHRREAFVNRVSAGRHLDDWPARRVSPRSLFCRG